MKRDLKGRRVLLTGASSGIGRCVAEQLVQAQAHVVAMARSGDKLQELENACRGQGAECIPVTGDVTSADDRRRAIDTAVQRLGGLDILINNAGVSSFAHFIDSDEAVLRQIMEVNFFGPAELSRLAIPILARGQQPAIVNVGSTCGRRGLPAYSEYSASKFALTGFTEGLRAELVRFGIDVLLVIPGTTKTDVTKHLLRNQGRMNIGYDNAMPPEQVAAALLKALCRNKNEVILGRKEGWLLRVNRFFPRFVDWMIARRVRKLYAIS